MMTLKWIQDVKPHELGKLEQPFVALSYVTRAYHDKFNPEVRGIDEVIKRFSAFSIPERDSNTLDKLTKAINEGDIVLMHHHSNIPFSPIFVEKKPLESEHAQNIDSTKDKNLPTSAKVEYEVNPSLQGRYMFARNKFSRLQQGFYWPTSSLPKTDSHDLLDDDTSEDSFEGNAIAPGVEPTQEITEEATANLELDYCFDDTSPVDDIPFEVTDSAGTKHTGTLSKGKASLSGLPLGSCQVVYVSDSDEIEAELTRQKTQLSNALNAMIAEVKVIAAREDALFEQESFISQYFIRKGAQLTGLYQGGKNFVVGACDLALLLDEVQGEARDAALNALKKLAAGDAQGIKQDLETLFVHSAKQLDDLADAFELLLAIADDKALLKQIATFPYDYIDAHSIVEKEKIGGILAFEILLCVLTAGAGAAVSAASQSKYLLKANSSLQKIATLLKRKKLAKKTSPSLKQGDNLDVNSAPKQQLELEDKPKVVPNKSMPFDYTKARALKPGEKLGNYGESIVEDMLRADGYETFYRVQNKSGNGVDIVAKKANGDIIRAEVKTTQQARLWNDGKPKDIPLRGDQKTMGGEAYTTDRLERAINKDDGYTDGVVDVEAEKAQQAIEDALLNDNSVIDKKYDVYVDKNGTLLANPIEKDWLPKP
ncbi:hypothetical protein PN836_005570 [Ningiella sp. W23]|uniref:hypothetical protein n=1 Tax=Ningiella sp. W23 TaxID=3023715 RepID=UPI003757B2B4